jgi:hypothetical protein
MSKQMSILGVAGFQIQVGAGEASVNRGTERTKF